MRMISLCSLALPPLAASRDLHGIEPHIAIVLVVAARPRFTADKAPRGHRSVLFVFTCLSHRRFFVCSRFAVQIKSAFYNRAVSDAYVSHSVLALASALLVFDSAFERWRLLGPLTPMNGVLLFGWSTAVVFEVL